MNWAGKYGGAGEMSRVRGGLKDAHDQGMD